MKGTSCGASSYSVYRRTGKGLTDRVASLCPHRHLGHGVPGELGELLKQRFVSPVEGPAERPQRLTPSSKEDGLITARIEAFRTCKPAAAPALAKLHSNSSPETVSDISGYRSQELSTSSHHRTTGILRSLFIGFSIKPVFDHLPMRSKHFAKRVRRRPIP